MTENDAVEGIQPLTGGFGADVVIDAVGRSETWKRTRTGPDRSMWLTAAPPGSSPWRPQMQLPSRQSAADVRDFIRDAKWRLLVMKERSGGGVCASDVA
jgi:threonine dehydrogenase-like Zn-dependent dehydrogenase